MPVRSAIQQRGTATTPAPAAAPDAHQSGRNPAINHGDVAAPASVDRRGLRGEVPKGKGGPKNGSRIGDRGQVPPSATTVLQTGRPHQPGDPAAGAAGTFALRGCVDAGGSVGAARVLVDRGSGRSVRHHGPPADRIFRFGGRRRRFGRPSAVHTLWPLRFSASMNGCTVSHRVSFAKKAVARLRCQRPPGACGSRTATRPAPHVHCWSAISFTRVDLGLVDPRPNCGLGEIEVLGDLSDRAVTTTAQLDDLGLELRRERATRLLLPDALHDGRPPGAEASHLGCPSKEIKPSLYAVRSRSHVAEDEGVHKPRALKLTLPGPGRTAAHPAESGGGPVEGTSEPPPVRVFSRRTEIRAAGGVGCVRGFSGRRGDRGGRAAGEAAAVGPGMATIRAGLHPLPA